MDLKFNIYEKKINPNQSVFKVFPLYPGLGNTLGYSLRRVLLTAIPGAAITSVKFAGVRHQFATLPGVKEDLVEVILNLKKVALASESDEPVTVKIEKSGPGSVVVGDIKGPATVRVINKKWVLAHLANRKTKFAVEMTVEKGVGYSSADERKIVRSTLGVIPTDAIFTPILKVSYSVEDTRVGRSSNYDKLIIDVLTDGSITPKKAVKEAAKILVANFKRLYTPVSKKHKAVVKKTPQVAKLSVAELELPTRTVNALEKGGYRVVSDLLAVTPKDIMGVKNLGKKSVDLLIKILHKREVDWL